MNDPGDECKCEDCEPCEGLSVEEWEQIVLRILGERFR